MTDIIVDYQPGAMYSFTPKEFNVAWAYFNPSPDLDSGLKNTKTEHFESADAGRASASICTTKTQKGFSWAGVGVYCKLNLPSRGSYSKRSARDNIKNRPCTVTMTVSYDVAARGINTRAIADWGPNIWYAPYLSEETDVDGMEFVGGRPVEKAQLKSAATTMTWAVTVGDVFYPDLRSASISAKVDAMNQDAGAGQASASVFCSSIELEFPSVKSAVVESSRFKSRFK
jgi:hypothetical protein